MTGLPKPYVLAIDTKKDITSGLVFDSGFAEGSGSTSTEVVGGITGTITAATWDTDILGRDLDFSGATSDVSYSATPAGMNNLVQSQFSIEGLVYYRSTGGGGLGRIIQKSATSPNGPWIVLTGHTNSNQLTLQVTYNTTSGAWDWNGALPTNTWTHFVITYDGSSLSNTPNGYINGVLTTKSASVQPVGTPLVTDDTVAHIGNRGDGLRNWNGKISYVRVWNRILTATEAADLFRNTWTVYPKYQLQQNALRPRPFQPGLAR